MKKGKLDPEYLRALDELLEEEGNEDDFVEEPEDEIIEEPEDKDVTEVKKRNLTVSDVRSNTQALLYIVVDRSASMYNNGLEEGVINGLKEIKDLVNYTEEGDNIQIAMTFFGSTVEMRPFVYGNSIDTTYKATEQHTRLYDAIIKSATNMIEQYDQIEPEVTTTKGVMLIITDGYENGSTDYSESDVSAVLAELQEREIPVILAAFDGVDLSGFSNKFEYIVTRTFKNERQLRRLMEFTSKLALRKK